MSYPLVRDLAADGIPVTVTCRVLKIARQPYYRWLAQPVTGSELGEAYRANALFDAHKDDPEFGYRFLVDEAAIAGATAHAKGSPMTEQPTVEQPIRVMVVDDHRAQCAVTGDQIGGGRADRAGEPQCVHGISLGRADQGHVREYPTGHGSIRVRQIGVHDLAHRIRAASPRRTRIRRPVRQRHRTTQWIQGRQQRFRRQRVQIHGRGGAAFGVQHHGHVVEVGVLGQHVEAAEKYVTENPSAHLHMYGKIEAKHNRKMGHVTLFSDVPDSVGEF